MAPLAQLTISTLLAVPALGFVGTSCPRRSGSVHMMSRGEGPSAAEGMSRRDLLQGTTAAAAALGVSTLLKPQPANAAGGKAWEQVTDIPMESTFYDIAFDTAEPDHGWIVGSKGTFLETKDGGSSWTPRTFLDLDSEEEITYRFEKVSFKDGEGWIIGKPPIMLHTSDGGKSWERIPLSPKLPGEPSTIFATGPGSAEMTTTTGAVYKTTNNGRNWKAQVKETIDATLNRISSSGIKGASYFTGSIINVIRDAKNGAYLAVSSRGNFFLTWEPGQDFWVPHNRGSSRRIQNMGFVNGDSESGVWMTLNGGLLQLTGEKPNLEGDELNFKDAKIRTSGYGLIDVQWKDENEVWAVGGAGSMYVSKDGGKTFQFNGSADDIPGNLYKVKFFGPNKGFILGSQGVLLRYRGFT